ncbi:hypothetical protein A4X06_0g6062 [Tilletia controversa]|uniref:ENTH domain-containing protein n=1 Tax=Tilletia controversa TaxID=13291 RepID=A0A8X7SVK2_9BASI|nr:hypothetical protein A4X06_0g6062 [Tilletia controversa]
MSNYDKVVKLATKPKIAAPKPKYVDVLITASYSEDASLNEIIRSLANRLREPMTIVVFKSLVVLHTLVRHGSIDPVLSHLVSNASLLRLKHIASIDSPSGYTPPRSLTVYAQYIDTRVRAYRELRRDVIRSADSRPANGDGASGARSGSGLSGGQRLRRLKVEKGLLREVNITQKVMNAVLACSFFLDDPSDEITLAAFRMALKDLLDLYAAVNEGIINMLEHYFEMAKSDAKDALKIYREFCNQTEKVVAYLTAARKYSHALRVAIPQLKHAPVSLAGALEEYLNDPNFEENRVEYRKNRQIANGEPSPKGKDSEGKAKEDSGNKKGDGEDEKKAEASTSKPSIPSNNQALQDFFASIDTDQHTMNFSSSQQMPSAQQAMFTGAPGMFGAGPMGMQPTGMMLAPQQQQQQMMMMAGGGGGMLAPQMTGFNPFLQPNMTGMNPAFAAQQQQNAFLQAQLTGMNAFGGGNMMQQQQPQMTGMLQPQATAVNNPFRPQSVFMPTSAAGAGMSADLTGFGMMSPSGSSGNGSAFGSIGSSNAGGTAGGQSRLQSISENTGSSSTPAAPAPAAPAPAVAATTSTSSIGAPVKALLPQKTGSRNPFAPPPGETPPPPPVQPFKTGPSLFELASGAASQQQQQQTQNQNGDGLPAGSALVPQKTGMIGNIASEFTFAGRATSPAISAPASDLFGSAAPSQAQAQAQPQVGADSLTNGFGNFSLGGGASSSSALAPQPTGFGGSVIRPFQPTSSFGQTLSSQVTGMPSSGTLGAGGLGATGQALAPNMTGNPFARSMSPSAGGSSAGQSLFGGGGGASTNGSLSTNGLGSSSSSGFGGGAASPGPGGASFGASLFRSGTITNNNNGNVSSNPFPSSLAAQPTGAFLSSFTSGLNSVSSSGFGAGVGAPTNLSTLQAQPTGLGGSAIKPFQPTSAFGTAAFGGLTASGPAADAQKNQQQQQSLF